MCAYLHTHTHTQTQHNWSKAASSLFLVIIVCSNKISVKTFSFSVCDSPLNQTQLATDFLCQLGNLFFDDLLQHSLKNLTHVKCELLPEYVFQVLFNWLLKHLGFDNRWIHFVIVPFQGLWSLFWETAVLELPFFLVYFCM